MVCGKPLDDVAGLWHVEVCSLAVGIIGLESLIVARQDDGASGDGLDGMLAVVVHHGLNLISTSLAGLDDIDCLVVAESVFYIDFHEDVVEALAFVLGPCANLGEQ